MGKVRFDEIARECRETFKGSFTDMPIVGLEHIEPYDMKLKNCEVNVETTFTKRFHEGQILFGRRRAYQHKACVATFDGICSGDITVIEPIEGKVYPDLLPFIIQNDDFFEHAIKGSNGALSPRVKWEHMANFEFSLPSLSEQKILAEKLWAAYEVKQSYLKMIAATEEMVKAQFVEMFGSYEKRVKIGDHCSVSSGKSIPTKLEDIKGNIAYVKVADFNLPGNEKYIYNSQRYVAEESAKYSKMIPTGSVIFAKNGAASLSNKKRLTRIDCCIDMNTLAVKSISNDLRDDFLFAVLQSLDISEYVRQGAIPSISPKSIENCQIPYPTLEEQDKYISIAEQSDKSISELRKSVDAIDKVIKSLINENL